MKPAVTILVLHSYW